MSIIHLNAQKHLNWREKIGLVGLPETKLLFSLALIVEFNGNFSLIVGLLCDGYQLYHL